MSIKHIAKRVLMRNSVSSFKRKSAIMKFAGKFGFVYFGHVDQHDDEHHVIRGLTVSSTHQDEGYSVGSFDGYDVSVVDRLDIIESHDKKIKSHRWAIIEIDLHKGTDVPHIFLGAHDHRDSSYSKLFTSVNTMQAVPLGTLENHSEEFMRRYSLFSSPCQFIDVERLFTAEVTRTIAAHFWPLAVEVIDGALYIYSDTLNLTASVLEAMLKNGLWLAEQIDERAFSSVNID